MNSMNQKSQENPGLRLSRRNDRKMMGRLRWVDEHLHMTELYNVSRVSLPDKGERAGRRGRKATGQGWALIAGLPKEESFKRQRLCQDVRAY